VLFVAVFLLNVLGLLLIWSTALGKEDFYFLNFKKQLIFLIVGLVLLFIFAIFDYKWFRSYSLIIYFAAIVLLLGVLFFGKTIRGTRGWFSFGFLNFQPVEFAKLALIVFLSRYFIRGGHEIFRFRHILVSGGAAGILFLLVFLQPDFGSALILFFLWLGILLLLGIRRSHLAFIMILIAVLLCSAWFFVFEDYQKARIINFFNPTKDVLGAGYNIKQAQIAVGSGQIWGRGIGYGPQSQLRFVPESQTDFIFAVLAEELGLFGVLIFFSLWGVVFWRLWLISKKTRDDFSLFFVLGVMLLFFIQIFINIGMIAGLMPVTGITLPFLSYGGSALLINLVMIGISESISMRT
jgi:rod shape determining protein RodA